MKLNELNAAIKSKADAVSAIFATADKERDGICTAEEREQIITLNKEIEEMEVSAKSLAEQDALRARNQQRQDWLGQPANLLPYPQARTEGPETQVMCGAGPAAKSWGEAFVDAPATKAWIDRVAPGGKALERIRLQSDPIQVDLGLKALITGAGSTTGGPFVNVDYQGLLDRAGTFARPLRIRDLVTVLRTTSDTVEYPRIGAHTNAAAPVAEATATSGSSGAKPESTMVTSTVTETVKTIAHWIPATRRVLADAPQMRDLIDEFLRYGLLEELEDQIISGAGTGENFTGALNTTGTTAQAFATDLLTTYRQARTKITVTGRATPTAYVIHPNDWEDLDLLTDNEERYYFGGPVGMGTPRLWGVPVVESEAMTEGTAVLADWRMAVVWDRMQSQIYVSDSHSDLFVRNMLAILAELRAAFGIIRPAAFVEIALA